MSAVSNITLNEGFECNGEFLADISSCPSTGFSQRVGSGGSEQNEEQNELELIVTTPLKSTITQNLISPSFFPNPSSNGRINLYIPRYNEDKQSIANINISAILGSTIYAAQTTTQKFNTIDLSSQPKGIYIVQITMGEKIYVEKLVVQ